MSLTRYRIAEAAGTATVTDDMMLLTAVYGIIVGIVLVFIARRLKQHWMIFWGSGLSILSTGYLFGDLMNWI